MQNPLRFTLLVTLIFTTTLLSAAEKKKTGFARWQKAMDAFTAADHENPTPPGGVLFVGSSSIRLWDLKESFPNLNALNRGFGGSAIRDSIHFFDTLILKHRPRTVVLYAGDNDISGGYNAEQTHQDFLKFQKKLDTALPGTKLVFVAIKPSISRWKLAPTMHEANQMIAATCAEDDRLIYLDIWGPMLGEDGRPRPEYFRKDGLHLNAIGYDLWNKLLTPHLKE